MAPNDTKQNENPVIVITSQSDLEFETKCSEAVRNGYKIHSSSCGFINSEEYSFGDVFMAIFVKPEVCHDAK